VTRTSGSPPISRAAALTYGRARPEDERSGRRLVDRIGRREADEEGRSFARERLGLGGAS
jgi:hypothetical protein